MLAHVEWRSEIIARACNIGALHRGTVMYVRWKKQKSRRRPSVLLRAVIVQSVRIDGKPRQKIIAYVGSIHQEHIQLPHRRKLFWEKVEAKLEALKIDLATRVAFEAKIAGEVPKPLQDELDLQIENAQRLMESYRPFRNEK